MSYPQQAVVPPVVQPQYREVADPPNEPANGSVPGYGAGYGTPVFPEASPLASPAPGPSFASPPGGVAGGPEELFESLFEDLGRQGAEEAGIQTLEIVDEEAGLPTIAVYGPGNKGITEAGILVVDGMAGPWFVERVVRAARAGQLPSVMHTAAVIIVHPAADGTLTNLVTSLDSGYETGYGVPNGAPNGVPRPGLARVGMARNSYEAAHHVIGLTRSLAGRESGPMSQPPGPVADSANGLSAPPAAPPAHPIPDPGLDDKQSASQSASRAFDLVAGRRSRDAGSTILSPEQREAILDAREESERVSRDGRKGLLSRWPFQRGTQGVNAAEGPGGHIRVAPPAPVVWPPLKSEVVRGLHYSPYPSVFGFVNNKGGVGKTSLTIGTAAAFAQMGRNPSGPESLRVLVVEQNFLNPDIESRMQLKPGSVRGLGPYLEDLLSAWETGRFSPDSDPFDIRPYTAHSYVDNLDVLLIGTAEDERRIAEDYLTETAFEAVFRELYRSLGDAYDIVCVDLANSRPEADRGEAGKTSSARLIGFWASAADGIYVPFDSSKTSYEQARRVVSEARLLCVEDEAIPGVPPMAGVVPILNFFPEKRRGDLTWMEDDEEEARRLEYEYLPAVGADHALLPGVAPGSVTIKIPNYKEVTYYNNAGRIPCLESARFARAYMPIVMDASVRAYENQAIRAQAVPQ